MTRIEELSMQIHEEDLKWKKLLKEYKAISKKLQVPYNKKQKLTKERDLLILETKKEFSIEDLLECKDNEQSTEMYRAKSDYCWKKYGVQIAFEGPWMYDPTQNSVRIALIKGSNNEVLKDNLPAIINLIHENKDGTKNISIFEHTCAEHGSFRLSINKGNYILIKTTYNHPDEVYRTDNLNDMLDTLAKRCWYESTESEDEEF